MGECVIGSRIRSREERSSKFKAERPNCYWVVEFFGFVGLVEKSVILWYDFVIQVRR
jgi:hypothetical protein